MTNLSVLLQSNTTFTWKKNEKLRGQRIFNFSRVRTCVLACTEIVIVGIVMNSNAHVLGKYI